MEAGRGRLLRLGTPEIEELLAALPALHMTWARPCKVSTQLLAEMQPKAVRAVRANLPRDAVAFHEGLAFAAIARFSGCDDPQERVDSDAAAEAAQLLAVAAGDDLGPDLGSFILNIVAESSFPLAEVVRNELDALLELSAQGMVARETSVNPSEIRDLEGTDTATTIAYEPGSEVSEVSAPSGEQRPQPAPRVSTPDASTTLPAVDALLDSAPSVAGDLRSAAKEIELGSVPSRESAEALREADEWASRALRIAAPGTSLRDVAAALKADLQAQVVKREELEELARAFESLRTSGLEKHANDLLAHNEFSDIEALRHAIRTLTPPDRETPPGSGTTVDTTEPLAVSTDGPAWFPTDEVDSDTAESEVPSLYDPDPDVDEPVADGPVPSDAVSAARIDDRLASEPIDDGATVDVSPSADRPALVDQARGDAGREQPSADPAEIERDAAAEDSVSAVADSSEQPGADAPADASEIADDPWSSGLVASMISSERDGLAVLASQTLAAPHDRVQIAKLFAGAFGCRADTFLAQEPEIVLTDSPDTERNADDNRLLFAAYSRLALELGFSPVGSLERFRQAAALDAHPASEFAAEIVRLTTRGFKRPLGAVEVTALPDDWRRLAEAADSVLSSLQNISISYQRASRIVHYLARTNRPVGGALAKCAELAQLSAAGSSTAQSDWHELEALLVALRDPHELERLLTETDRALSTSQQLRKPIVASARDRLRSAMHDVADLLEDALTLRTRAEAAGTADDPQGMADLASIAGSIESFPLHGAGDAAIWRLIRWVQAEDASGRSASSLAQLLLDELLPLFELARDANSEPARTVLTIAELQTLIEGREPLTVFRGYLKMGNLRAAEASLSRSGISRTVGIDDEFTRATRALERRHRELLTEVDRTLDRLRSLLDDDLVRQLSQEADQHRTATPGRYDLHLGALADIRDRGESRLEEVRQGLRQRASAIPSPEESKRILDLLESRDEQLAVDYLTLAEAGEPLPVLEPPAGDDFGDFFPAVVRVAQGSSRQRALDDLNAVRKHLGATSGPTNRMLSQGLKSWNDLVIDRQARQMTEGRLANVLRMLGLIPADQRWIKELTKARHAGYATYAVKATPIDRSYVPSLGTQAHGSFDVTVVWDEASPQRLLQYVESNRRTQANIILYLRTLPAEQRLELRKLTARPGFDFSPIVVDMPVIAWLSTRDEPGWRLTQRVTLPFTTLNPYTPFAGGEVPDEVFVGRDAERQEIIDPTGSMFVYGGRQLGKSALLRRVERGIMSHRTSETNSFEDGQVAVYLDLKSEGIGESAEPAALWGALAPRLIKVGVLPTSLTEWTADSVGSGILEWLEADTSRRLLLLLDEADNFLTLDAKDTGPSKVGGFPVLQKLKGIMERTGRRFKPVFAGLHQVQRFHGLPNTPVVHGGQDILIGPLKAVDARELVRDPLYALGYEFETPDTMWRLLRLTNYQASLVQIICEALVRHMRGSALPRQGGRVVISSSDVDDVYAKRSVRDLIAQRFRWTINLDNRYKVIALVTALRSLESRPGERFRANELHDDCEYFWPAGFSRSILSSAEFLRYLEEMKGLGVLHRQGDEFGLRSPSILGLLGSSETIESELLEASEQLDVGYQYNPTMNRRTLSQDAAGAETRSPLPDADLAALLTHEPEEGQVRIVAGTLALGIDRVVAALKRAATERQVRLLEVEAPTLQDQLGGADDAHLILDLTLADAPTRRAALAVLSRSDAAFVTVVLSADVLPLDTQRADFPVTLLHRWSLEGLQSWHESPFRRHELKSATGGWPNLVEEAFSLVMRGASNEEALDRVEKQLRDPHAAREFIASAAVPLDIAATWLEWFGKVEDSRLVDLTPATIDDLSTAFDADARPTLERLQYLDIVDEAPEGWLLDRAVAAAVLAVQR